MNANSQPRAAGPADVLSRTDPRWLALREIIKTRSYMEGDFILSSGKRSNYMFQLRQTTMHPEGASLIGGAIVDYMRRIGAGCIGGPEIGAIPVVCAVIVESFHKSAPVKGFFIRKAAKAHGALEQIDGEIDPSGEVLLVDDVATSGKSILMALEVLKQTHPAIEVRKALVIVDRLEGASENLAANGVELVSLFRRSDFGI